MAVYKKEYFGIARKIVANMTSESWEQIPHAVIGYDADITDILREIKSINENVNDKEEKITINTVMLKIICEGLKAAPKMNCTIDFNRKLVRGTLLYHDNIDISMPVILGSGEMMTVNMHNMEDKNLTDIAQAVNDTVRKANNTDMNEVMFDVSMDNTVKGLKKGKIFQALFRIYGSKMPGKHRVSTMNRKDKKIYLNSVSTDNRLTKKDIEQGTVTISNLGSVCKNHSGSCYMLEIIPPQVAAFAISAAQKRPCVIQDENGKDKIEIRTILPLTVAIDHRALDYGDCVEFFKKLNEIFSNPSVISDWVYSKEHRKLNVDFVNYNNSFSA